MTWKSNIHKPPMPQGSAPEPLKGFIGPKDAIGRALNPDRSPNKKARPKRMRRKMRKLPRPR